MKTPREVAHADTVGHAAVAWCGFGRGGDVHSLWCDSRTQAIAARDAEHSRRTELARELLRRIRDCTSRADCGGCETCQDDARAALQALEEK